MQKKINILSILLMLFLLFGLVSTCNNPDFREGMKEGYEDAREDYKNDNGLSAAVKTTDVAELSESPIVRRITVNLARKDFHCFGEKVVNTKTGDVLPASIQKAIIIIENSESSSWLPITLAIPVIPGGIFFVRLLMSFIAEIKDGDIFVKGNEWKLKWMSVLALYWGLAEWICEVVEYSYVKSTVEFEDYIVSFDKPSVLPFILAITFLLFAEIFALGRKMKEDQEFMV